MHTTPQNMFLAVLSTVLLVAPSTGAGPQTADLKPLVRASSITGDQIYLLRVTPGLKTINDRSAGISRSIRTKSRIR